MKISTNQLFGAKRGEQIKDFFIKLFALEYIIFGAIGVLAYWGINLFIDINTYSTLQSHSTFHTITHQMKDILSGDKILRLRTQYGEYAKRLSESYQELKLFFLLLMLTLLIITQIFIIKNKKFHRLASILVSLPVLYMLCSYLLNTFHIQGYWIDFLRNFTGLSRFFL